MPTPVHAFRQSTEIRSSREKACACYARPQHQQEVHPLIDKVTTVRDSGEGPRPRMVLYAIEENVPLMGIFKVFNRYMVRLQETDPPHEPMFDAFSKPAARLRSVIRFEQLAPDAMRVAGGVAGGVAVAAPPALARLCAQGRLRPPAPRAGRPGQPAPATWGAPNRRRGQGT